MTAEFFVDTNVLVYAYDSTDKAKQFRAIELLDRLVASSAGVISTQVLAEFFSTVTRPNHTILSIEEAEARLQYYVRFWKVIDLSSAIVLEAVRGVRDYQFNFWDAQIWATARLNGIQVVFSEGFSSGATIESVRFENPPAPHFQLSRWIS